MMQKARACRLGTPCVPRTFKQLLQCRTQHHQTLTTERIADLAAIRKDRLYAFANENDPSEIPFKALLKVCAAIGDRDLLDFELEPYGLRTVEIDRRAAGDLAVEMLDVAVASGRLADTIRDAKRDGRIDAVEVKNIHQLTRGVRHELDDVDAAAERART